MMGSAYNFRRAVESEEIRVFNMTNFCIALGLQAGAMGVPVWLVLHFAGDWRWLRGRNDSPWYPTMRLFRQQTSGDWSGVFEQVAGALRERLQGG